MDVPNIFPLQFEHLEKSPGHIFETIYKASSGKRYLNVLYVSYNNNKQTASYGINVFAKNFLAPAYTFSPSSYNSHNDIYPYFSSNKAPIYKFFAFFLVYIDNNKPNGIAIIVMARFGDSCMKYLFLAIRLSET